MIDHTALDIRDPEKCRWFYEQPLGTDGRAKLGLRPGSLSGSIRFAFAAFRVRAGVGDKDAWAKVKRCRRRWI